jgi:hypothetical protein
VRVGGSGAYVKMNFPGRLSHGKVVVGVDGERKE